MFRTHMRGKAGREGEGKDGRGGRAGRLKLEPEGGREGGDALNCVRSGGARSDMEAARLLREEYRHRKLGKGWQEVVALRGDAKWSEGVSVYGLLRTGVLKAGRGRWSRRARAGAGSG